MSNEGYRRALNALQFFCFEGDRQVESIKMPKAKAPVFFTKSEEKDIGCDYLLGVACVFITYKGHLYDNLSSVEDADRLEDFAHRLIILMHHGSAAEWSASSAQNAAVWKRLREDARAALQQLGETVPNDAPDFDIEALINPDEFRVSNEVRTLLD